MTHFNTPDVLVSTQVNMWKDSCVVTPSFRCPPSVRSLVPRTAHWAPGPHGPPVPIPALEKTQRASRPELAPSWLITQEKVGNSVSEQHQQTQRLDKCKTDIGIYILTLDLQEFHTLFTSAQVKCQNKMNYSVCSSAATAKIVAWVTVTQGKKWLERITPLQNHVDTQIFKINRTCTCP